jgi:AcrR family transcriptional regulator
LSKPQSRYDLQGRYLSLLAAGEVLLCSGYDNARPQSIAKTAGVSVGLFYRHFKHKQDLLTAIMVRHLGILHEQILLAVEDRRDPVAALNLVLILTLRYFQAHQGLIELFFMEIGYGDRSATAQLLNVRQTYRNILESIVQSGIDRGVFLSTETMDMQIAINSIIGTINWSLYDLIVVKQQSIEAEDLASKLSAHILRGLGYNCEE